MSEGCVAPGPFCARPVTQHLAIALIVIGVVVSAAGGLIFWNSLAQTRWSPVDATVLDSEIGLSSMRFPGTNQASSQWTLKVRYAYEVDGRRYESDSVSSVPFSSSASDGAEPSAILRDLVAAFPTGATVTAWVNPDDPERAVLFPAENAYWVVLAAGAAVLALGVLVLIGFGARSSP